MQKNDKFERAYIFFLTDIMYLWPNKSSTKSGIKSVLTSTLMFTNKLQSSFSSEEKDKHHSKV